MTATDRKPTATQRARWRAQERYWRANPCVWISPGRHSGAPCVGGHRLAVEFVATAHWLRDNAAELYDLSHGQVAAAAALRA